MEPPDVLWCIVLLTLQRTSRAFRRSRVFPLPSGEEENTVTVVSDLDQPALSGLSCTNKRSCMLLHACHSVQTSPRVVLARLSCWGVVRDYTSYFLTFVSHKPKLAVVQWFCEGPFGISRSAACERLWNRWTLTSLSLSVFGQAGSEVPKSRGWILWVGLAGLLWLTPTFHGLSYVYTSLYYFNLFYRILCWFI